MGIRRPKFRAVLAALSGSLLLGAAGLLPAQAPDTPQPQLPPPVAVLPDQLPAASSQPPAITIAAEPLGFTANGAPPLGLHQSFLSLDFLDENHLLFTFRIPGLVHRGSGDSEERTVRAVVISLPSGQVAAEAVWTLHDRAPYLWPLPDGHFLLRDGQELRVGDATLVLKPSLRFPGPVESLQPDPSGAFLVASSREPRPAQPGLPPEPEYVTRILRRSDGRTLYTSRSAAPLKLPVNAEGLVELQPIGRTVWRAALNRFAGGYRGLGAVESQCQPEAEFLAPQLFLTLSCADEGGLGLSARTTAGRTLWQMRTQGMAVEPRFLRSAGGLRFLRQIFSVERPLNAQTPVDASQIKGQLVQALDALDGRVVLEARTSPGLDAGGNAAISPTGRRVALLNAGNLEIYELPPPPAIPVLVPSATAR